MDYWYALGELYQERERLTTVIRNLEALVEGKESGPLSRRGRKQMLPEERAQVSERMRKYWASRRGKHED
jgi:hypothetical protein